MSQCSGSIGLKRIKIHRGLIYVLIISFTWEEQLALFHFLKMGCVLSHPPPGGGDTHNFRRRGSGDWKMEPVRYWFLTYKTGHVCTWLSKNAEHLPNFYKKVFSSRFSKPKVLINLMISPDYGVPSCLTTFANLFSVNFIVGEASGNLPAQPNVIPDVKSISRRLAKKNIQRYPLLLIFCRFWNIFSLLLLSTKKKMNFHPTKHQV